MRSSKSPTTDIAPDPFLERLPLRSRTRLRLLGSTFEFECESARLRRLVDWAFADLPRHRLSATATHCRVRLALAPRHRRARGSDAPRIGMLSGAGMLCATTASSDLAVVDPASRSALVVLSRDMLRFPYQARYELIEFAVFTLAQRTQQLVPLHAACVGRQGRGLLLMGESGAGKSTAALHCLLRGLEFVSEDSVFVAADTLLATGLANFLHVRCDSVHSLPAATAAAIRNSPVIRRRSGVEKFEVDLRRGPYSLAATPLKITALVYLCPDPARGAELLTPLPRREALERLAAGQAYAVHQPGWTTFRRRMARTPAFELRRGRKPGEAAASLQRLLAGAAPGKR